MDSVEALQELSKINQKIDDIDNNLRKMKLKNSQAKIKQKEIDLQLRYEQDDL